MANPSKPNREAAWLTKQAMADTLAVAALGGNSWANSLPRVQSQDS